MTTTNDTCPKCGAEKLLTPDDGRADKYVCGSMRDVSFRGQVWERQSDTCRILQLENAIRTHRSQKADDRCIEDDDRLYEALGDGVKCDRRVGDQCAMLANCKRFIENRTEGGGWPTYAELERRVQVLRQLLKKIPIAWVQYPGSRPREEADIDAALGINSTDKNQPVQ